MTKTSKRPRPPATLPHAALDAIAKRIDELTIRSPVDGVVEALDLQPGDLASTAAPVLSDHGQQPVVGPRLTCRKTASS